MIERLNDNHDDFMQLAIESAKQSLPVDVPVGAVIVDSTTREIISRAFNERESQKSATAHAEISAINQACSKLKTRRLSNCIMYVTLEPCVMCAGALVQSHMGGVVFGATDPNYGAAGSIYNFFSDPKLAHNPEVHRNVRATDCAKLLNEFFETKR